jgi:hypothetical protein
MREGLFWGWELSTSTSDSDVDFTDPYGPLDHARYPGVFYLISGDLHLDVDRVGLFFGTLRERRPGRGEIKGGGKS